MTTLFVHYSLCSKR